MPAYPGPRCGDCGEPRWHVAGGRRVECPCRCPRSRDPVEAADINRRSGAQHREPDGQHYADLPTQRPPRKRA